MNLNDLSKDLSNIDLENIGRAPLVVRAGLVAMVMAITLFIGYQFDIKDLQLQLETVQAEEAKLKDEVVSKQHQVANLEAYKVQLAEMEQTFGTLLRQLPNKKEVENLIVDVSQTALANGLKNQQIQPGSEVMHDFYAEVPYTLRLQGGYHQLAKFASDTASLPRIVTLHDFVTISPSKEFSNNKELSLQINIKTYRYLEDDERPAAAPAKGKTGARKSKG